MRRPLAAGIGNGDAGSIAGDPLGLEMPDRLSSSERLQDFYALVSPVGRNNGGDWASDRFLGRTRR